MAGWFPMDLDLQDKPEFLVVQAELAIDPDLLVGKLWKFWGWFDEQTTDGVMPKVTAKIINARIGVERFAEAMIEAGWLVLDETGAKMPGFDKRHSNSSKQRLSHAKRQAGYRKRDEAGHDDSTDAAHDQHENSTTPAPTSHHNTRHTSSSPNPSPAPSRSASKAKQAAEEAEAVKSLGPEWAEALAAVQRAGPKAAAGAVLAASELGHTPDGVKALAATFVRHRKLFASSGALVDRLTTVGPEVPANLGWIVDIPAEPTAAKPREPTLDERAVAYAAELKARGVTGEERVRLMDAWHEKHAEPVASG